MASTTQDDGFHEIQLNGKQLVFLFMAATVVSVVIFLCGVLVGRGVRADRGPSVELSAMNDTPLPLSPAPVVAVTPQAPAAGSDPRSAAAPPPVPDDNTYFSRLEGKNPNPGAEELKTSAPPKVDAAAARPAPPALSMNVVKAPQASKPEPSKAPAPPTPAKVAPAKAPEASPSSAATSRPTATAAGSYTVQVAAVNVRREAEQIAKRLEGKGYPAFVVEPAKGAPAMFRVRIGAFKTKGEAEVLAAKLKSQEHFQPWVTR